MRPRLAFGTKDAKILYHAGMIAADLGDTGRARAAAAGGARSRPELRRAPGRAGPGDPRGSPDDAMTRCGVAAV